MFRTLCIALLLGLLAACGFTLRGSGSDVGVLPPTQIQGIAASHALAKALRTQLVVAGTDSSADTWVLHIDNEQWDKRVVSFTSAGAALEYELRYEVSFHFSPATNEESPRTRQVVVTRDYGFDPGRVLAKSAEEQMVRDSMVEQAAARIIQQLRYNKRTPTALD